LLASVLLLVSPATLLPTRSEAAGEVYWFSLLSDNMYAAMGFYMELFGWEFETSPTGAYMAMRNGTPFAGLNNIEDRIPGSSESLWLAAITVADIEQSVATARELGATVHTDITHLPGWGTFALIQDPQGAPLILVVPERQLGGTEGYSGWRWAELWTHDTAAAADFYTKVIGYEIEQLAVGDDTYTVFRSDGKRNAGLVDLEEREIAPRWAPYVGVTDLRAVLVRVWEEGGKVLREPAEIDFEAAGTNRVALIADPSGGAMFLYQLEERATADPGVAARTTTSSFGAREQASSGSGGPNINVSVSVSYGTGWGTMYPTLPYRPYGPVPFY
jgi:predicted enzyme related to lactoylglutathione lyase